MTVEEILAGAPEAIGALAGRMSRCCRIFFALLFACGPTKPPATPPTAEPAPNIEVEVETPSIPSPSGDSITLRRTWCLGPCPIYDVTLFQSGHAAWRGEAHVGTLGRASRAVSPEVVAELLAAAMDLQADDGSTWGCATDFPGIEITLVQGDVRRDFVLDTSCLASICESDDACTPIMSDEALQSRGWSRQEMLEVDALADAIDRAVPTDIWIRASEAGARRSLGPG